MRRGEAIERIIVEVHNSDRKDDDDVNGSYVADRSKSTRQRYPGSSMISPITMQSLSSEEEEERHSSNIAGDTGTTTTTATTSSSKKKTKSRTSPRPVGVARLEAKKIKTECHGRYKAAFKKATNLVVAARDNALVLTEPVKDVCERLNCEFLLDGQRKLTRSTIYNAAKSGLAG